VIAFADPGREIKNATAGDSSLGAGATARYGVKAASARAAIDAFLTSGSEIEGIDSATVAKASQARIGDFE
jgi:hypothetical protein